MLVRGQTTEERIGEIANKFNQGLQGYAQSQQQELAQINQQKAQSLQQEALRRQQALQSLDISAKISDQTGKYIDPGQVQNVMATGNMQGIGDLLKNAPATPKFEAEQRRLGRENEKYEYESKQRSLPVEQRDDFKKSAAIAEIKNNSAQNLYYAKQDAEVKKKIQQASIPGFKISDPSVIPTSKDAEEIKKMNDSNKNLQDVGKSLIIKLSSMNPADRTGLTNNWKLVEQDLTQMALQGKELANLGALSGPDFELMNKDIGSISLGSINTIGVKGAISRVQSMLDRSKAKLRNKAQSRGYDHEEDTEADTKEARLQRFIELRARKAGG